MTDEPQWIVFSPVRQKLPAPTAAERNSAACFPCCVDRLEQTVFSEYPSIKPTLFPPDVEGLVHDLDGCFTDSQTGSSDQAQY